MKGQSRSFLNRGDATLECFDLAPSLSLNSWLTKSRVLFVILEGNLRSRLTSVGKVHTVGRLDHPVASDRLGPRAYRLLQEKRTWERDRHRVDEKAIDTGSMETDRHRDDEKGIGKARVDGKAFGTGRRRRELAQGRCESVYLYKANGQLHTNTGSIDKCALTKIDKNRHMVDDLAKFIPTECMG